MSVALFIQQAKHKRLIIVSCAASQALSYFSTQSNKWHDFQINVIKHNMFVLFFYTTFVWGISHSKKKWASYDQKYIVASMESTRYSCQILMKLEFSRQIFAKYSNIKLNENPSSGSRDVPWRRTDRRTDRSANMMKLIVAFRNFADGLKN